MTEDFLTQASLYDLTETPRAHLVEVDFTSIFAPFYPIFFRLGIQPQYIDGKVHLYNLKKRLLCVMRQSALEQTFCVSGTVKNQEYVFKLENAVPSIRRLIKTGTKSKNDFYFSINPLNNSFNLELLQPKKPEYCVSLSAGETHFSITQILHLNLEVGTKGKSTRYDNYQRSAKYNGNELSFIKREGWHGINTIERRCVLNAFNEAFELSISDYNRIEYFLLEDPVNNAPDNIKRQLSLSEARSLAEGIMYSSDTKELLIDCLRILENFLPGLMRWFLNNNARIRELVFTAEEISVAVEEFLISGYITRDNAVVAIACDWLKAAGNIDLYRKIREQERCSNSSAETIIQSIKIAPAEMNERTKIIPEQLTLSVNTSQ